MYNLLRVVVASAVGIAGIVFSAGSAAALCVFLPSRDAAAIAAAPVAFVGTVAFTANGGRTAYFTVDEVWRGPDLAWMTVVHGQSDDPGVIFEDDRTWMNGTRYLVLPYADANGELRDDACSGTAPYQAPLDALRPANARPPAVPLLAAALIVLAAAIALVLWQAIRRRADERRLAD